MPKPSIISLSIPPKLLDQLDILQSEGGFSGRSEAIRAGLRLLAQEHRDRKQLKGKINAVLLILHDEEHGAELAAIRHHYQANIRTQLHDHLHDDTCMDLMLLYGDSQDIVKLAKLSEACKGVQRTTLLAL